MATTTAPMAMATEDAPDLAVVGAGVLVGASVLTVLAEAPEPLLVLGFVVVVGAAVLPTVAVPALLPADVVLLLALVLLDELLDLAQAVWIGVTRSVSSFIPSSVQSPSPRLLTAVSTVLHAVEAQSLGRVSAVGAESAVNEKPESAVQVATFGFVSSGEILVRSQSVALATASEAATVMRENFIVDCVKIRRDEG